MHILLAKAPPISNPLSIKAFVDRLFSRSTYADNIRQKSAGKSLKADEDILKRTEEVISQKAIIEEKNKDITDSIKYAKKIQQALMPDTDLLKRSFSESFGRAAYSCVVVIIHCPSCKSRYKFDDTKLEGVASKKVRCPKCKTIIEVANPKMTEHTDSAVSSGLEPLPSAALSKGPSTARFQRDGLIAEAMARDVEEAAYRTGVARRKRPSAQPH